MVHNLSCAILGAIQPLRLTELDLKFSADMVQAGMVTEPSASFGTFCGKLPRVLLTMTLLLHLVDLPSGGPSRTSRSCRDAAACTGHHRPVCACAWRAFYGLTTQAASTHAIAYYLVKRAGQVISQRDLVRGPRSLRNPAAERLMCCTRPSRHSSPTAGRSPSRPSSEAAQGG